MMDGVKVHFLNPNPKEIRIRDIALHLAKTCRYQGHVTDWYSNAEHSILGTHRCHTIELKREFLIHDAAEYVFGDMPAPVKIYCTDYKRLIGDFERFLNRLFLGYPEFDHRLKEIDDRITNSEMKFMRHQSPESLYAPVYPDFSWENWNPEQAYDRYMKAFKLYFPEYTDCV